MGHHHSKAAINSSHAISLHTNLVYKTELSYYEAACRLDQDLLSFDKNLHARTNHVINIITEGVEVRALSFDSLKEITKCLLDMNQEVVKIVLDCKEDIWRNRELSELVEEYLEISLETLNLCAALESCLKQAQDRRLLILVALEQFEEENQDSGRNHDFRKTLEELKKFKESDDPFTEELFKIFQSVFKHQTLMLEKLLMRQNKISKKLNRIHFWRKVTKVIFISALAAVLICSVVAAAIAAPPVVAALAGASVIPIGSMGKWIDSLYNKYEAVLNSHKEVAGSMQTSSYVRIKDLETITALIDKLEVQIRAMAKDAELAIDKGAVKIAIREIKKKLEEYMHSVEDLGLQVKLCSREIRRARAVVLQRLINTK